MISYLHSFLVKLVILFLQGYRKFLSPLLPDACRYHPSCSAYFIDALKKHGLFKGLIMGCARLLRCNPFFKGGFDPVP